MSLKDAIAMFVARWTAEAVAPLKSELAELRGKVDVLTKLLADKQRRKKRDV